MSRESHERYLRQAALREAQKAIDRSRNESLRKEYLERLRIQTVEPWKRVTLFLVGLLLCGLGVVAMKKVAVGLGVLLGLGGMFCMSAALVGRKRTIAAALDGLDLVELFDALF